MGGASLEARKGAKYGAVAFFQLYFKEHRNNYD